MHAKLHKEDWEMNSKGFVLKATTLKVMSINRLRVTGSIAVDVPADKALAILHNIERIERYEPKVDSIQVKPLMAATGTYSAQGHFAGMPWRGAFSYHLNDWGFQSEMVRGAMGIRVKAGFSVKSESVRKCSITHYEDYRLPYWASMLTLLLRPYLFQAMRREMSNLAEVIQTDAGLEPQPEAA
jgi:hypothetical protein